MKSWDKRVPILGSALAHLLASLKQCWILTLEILLRHSLQSANITTFPVRLHASFYKRSTTSFASSSISTIASLRSMHMLIPSRSAHNSATMLVVYPTDLAYPQTESPWKFLMIPPQLARPGFPREDPSVFNLNQFSGGGIHLAWILVKGGLIFPFKPKKANSNSLIMASEWTDLWGDPSLNITLLWFNQRLQTPKGKMIPQGMPEVEVCYDLQLIHNQLNRFEP